MSSNLATGKQSYEQMQAQILASQQRSVASSERTVQMMQQSETIGVETANVSFFEGGGGGGLGILSMT